MHPERWKQVDSLLQAALARRRDERDAFLREACMNDDDLEREVRSLLASEDERLFARQKTRLRLARHIT
jgi:serine/threonine-protein kinase